MRGMVQLGSPEVKETDLAAASRPVTGAGNDPVWCARGGVVGLERELKRARRSGSCGWNRQVNSCTNHGSRSSAERAGEWEASRRNPPGRKRKWSGGTKRGAARVGKGNGRSRRRKLLH